MRRLESTFALAAVVATLLPAVRAAAFALEGHEIIEATAYKRLLATDAVAGTSPVVSGRTLLASLMMTGVLLQPPCFDPTRPTGDCGAIERLELPLGYWPVLGSGTPDLVIDRQIGQHGQCQHFMAPTADGLTPIDPRLGVPSALANDAYLRCVRVAGIVFDGTLRDPYLARQRMAGTYVLMHALEDSFSAAHVDRDAEFKIVHMLSWTLIDWPSYFLHGHGRFPSAFHHGISDPRDHDYLQWKLTTPDGRSCGSFGHPYAVPESCLTPRAKAATAAIVAYLVALYDLRARAAREGRTASLFATSDDARRVWRSYLDDHLPSVAATPELPAAPQDPRPRPDVFLGLQVILDRGTWGLGIWYGKLFFARAVLPFALGLVTNVSYVRSDDVRTLRGGFNINLMLPLVRRVTIGAAPLGVRLVCDTHVEGCSVEAIATAGLVLIPLGTSTWIALQGPQYSWTARTWIDRWGGLAVGWSHERAYRPEPTDPDAVARWDPPRPDEVRSYRMVHSTRAIFLSATMESRPGNEFIGAGLDWRWDRDRWNRRSGICPGVQGEVYEGAFDQTTTHGGSGIALAPTVRAYLAADRLAVVATPALFRFGALGDGVIGADVAARAGVALEIGQLELSVDSPPLSYVSRDRWHTLPFSVRLAALLD